MGHIWAKKSDLGHFRLQCELDLCISILWIFIKLKPYSHGISIIWGPCVILNPPPPPPPTSEFRVVHSHGISEACDFTQIY